MWLSLTTYIRTSIENLPSKSKDVISEEKNLRDMW